MFTTFPDQSHSTIPAPDTAAPTRGLSNLDPTYITLRRALVQVIVFRGNLRNHKSGGADTGRQVDVEEC